MKSHVRTKFPVDYNLEPAAVFVSAANGAFSYEQKAYSFITLLEDFNHNRKSICELPSWCPDFSAQNEDPIYLPRAVLCSLEKVTVPKPGPLGQVSVALNSNVIAVSGFQLDSVVKACSALFAKSSSQSLVRKLYQPQLEEQFLTLASSGETLTWFDEVYSLFLNGKVKAYDDLADKFLRLSFTVDPSDSLPPATIRSYLDKLRVFCLNAQTYLQELPLSSAADKSTMWYKQMKIYGMLVSINRLRVLFLTSSGRLGIATAVPTIGDQLCAIPGGAYLQILSADGKRFVGSAWVDGLTGDEPWKRLDRVGAEMETFHLE